MTIPFESVLYLSGATGATTKRTSAAREADIFNVKDFGAVGNGVAIDTTAIQAAINSAVGINKGIVFFPPGTYLIDAPLTPGTINDNASYILTGCGSASTITGSFANFLFRHDSGGGGSADAIQVIEKLAWHNGSTSSASGCVMVGGGVLKVSYCSFEGYAGLDVSGTTLSDTSSCVFHGYNMGYGLAMDGQSSCYNCDFKYLGDGIRASGIGNGIFAPHAELCRGSAIAAGFDVNQNPLSIGGSIITGLTAEGCGIGIYCVAMDSCTITGAQIHGEHFYGSVGGIRARDSMSNTTISNIKSYGDFGWKAFITGSVSGSTGIMTVTAVDGGGTPLAVGQEMFWVNLSNAVASLGTITGLGTGTGGLGTYQLSAATAVAGGTGMTATDPASTNPSVEVGHVAANFPGCTFENVQADATVGVAWQVYTTCGVQLRGCNYTPTSQTVGSPPSSPRDGDMWVFTDCNTAAFTAGSPNVSNIGKVVAAGGSNKVRAVYSSNTSTWTIAGPG